MELFSHKYDNRHKNKLLQHHLSMVEANMKDLFYLYVNFPSYLNIEEMVSFIGKFHDFGKATSFFQKYLDNKFHGSEKNHAFISAIAAYNFSKDKSILSDIEKFFLYYIIKNHHTNLKYLKNDSFLNSSFIEGKSIFNIQKNDLLQQKTNIKKTLNINITDKYFNLDIDGNMNRVVRNIEKKKPSIENYFFLNYLFSLLIEADKLDASNTRLIKRQCILSNSIDNYIKKILKSTDLKSKKNRVKVEIENKILEIDIDKEKLFTLTAPTGIGKTLSSLNFAIKLQNKIQKEKNYIPQIIYCLPFINIIEQTEKILSDIFFDNNIRIIKHHSYSDIFSNEKDNKNLYYDYNNYQMLTETWQGEIVLTTFVQFMHTLIGNKNRLLKKFSHLAGSIIILDEVQALDCKYWPLIGSSLYYLTKYLDAKIVLMTATQPYLFNNITKLEITENIKPRELLTNYSYYFKELKRTKIIPKINEVFTDNEDFLQCFLKYYQKRKSCLIVLNTIKRSKDIFSLVKENFKNEIKKKTYYVLYLSTAIVPKKRLTIIKKIKKLLKNNLPVILISTQSIEAGVDLDFDMGFRDIGPFDSIIQVAGRINREDTKGREHSPLYIVNFGKDAFNVYGNIIPSISNKILSKYSEIKEEKYSELICEYFETLSKQESQDITVFDAMKSLNYTENNNKKGVDSFALIETRNNVIDVFIDLYSGKHKKRWILKRYLKAVNNKDREEILRLKRCFRRYVISCNKDCIKSLPEQYMIYDNLYYIPNNMMKQYYDEVTGIILPHEQDDSLMVF